MPTTAPDRSEVAVFADASEFRRWLEQHHDSAPELWVGYYRKSTGKLSMTYPQAVEEALAFGWIDGITRRIDDEVHANRFTPRRRTSIWSAINIAKVAELKAAGRMHPAGLRAFEERDRRKDGSYSYERPPAHLPADMLRRLQADATAWAYWQASTPSFRRQATYWIVSAKRPETRERRFVVLLAASAAGQRPAPFLANRAERAR